MEALSKGLIRYISELLTVQESGSDKEHLATWIIEKLSGLSRAALLSNCMVRLNEKELDAIIRRLNTQEPIQYVLGESYFYGRKFMVNSSVLIPRPETELIIDEVKTFAAEGQSKSMLDIGTGSGCIAITLALEIPHSTIMATDVSISALTTAKENATRLGASVKFIAHNILTEPLEVSEESVVVSNPPYIRMSERSAMEANVLNFEPSAALFVPDENPLVFHENIAEEAFRVLMPNGMIIMEINEALGRSSADVLMRTGYHNVRIVRDLTGRDRFVKGLKSG
jgi:release factor glutamine methyltransferase